MQHEHAQLGARALGGERLAMGPDAENRIAVARIELGDDGDLGVRAVHQRRWVASVRCASRALR